MFTANLLYLTVVPNVPQVYGYRDGYAVSDLRELASNTSLLTMATMAEKNEQMSWRHQAEGEGYDDDDPLSGEEGFEGVWGEQGQPHPGMATGKESGEDEHAAARGGGFGYLDAVEPTARWADRAIRTIEKWPKLESGAQDATSQVTADPDRYSEAGPNGNGDVVSLAGSRASAKRWQRTMARDLLGAGRRSIHVPGRRRRRPPTRHAQ